MSSQAQHAPCFCRAERCAGDHWSAARPEMYRSERGSAGTAKVNNTAGEVRLGGGGGGIHCCATSVLEGLSRALHMRHARATAPALYGAYPHIHGLPLGGVQWAEVGVGVGLDPYTRPPPCPATAPGHCTCPEDEGGQQAK